MPSTFLPENTLGRQGEGKMKTIPVERQLYLVDRFIQSKARSVTKKPVYTEISSKRFGPNVMAHLIAYPNASRPSHYAVVFKTTFYNRNKNQNLAKLKQIGAHELAHIKYPHRHTKQFVETARKLGAGKYSNTRSG
jgi:hypothetical protein